MIITCSKNKYVNIFRIWSHDDYIQNNEMSRTPDKRNKIMFKRAHGMRSLSLHRVLFISCRLFVLDILQLHHRFPFQAEK